MTDHSRPSPPLVALLTDFQTRDWYVSVMKAVLFGICPVARCIDITHEVPAQDIGAARFILRQAYVEFPPGTIFLVVVDPGVGTGRRPVIVTANDQYFVGPDNGIFSFLPQAHPEACTIRHLQPFWDSHPLRSTTFHGRDLFAPAAAHLALGTPLERFGEPLETLVDPDSESGEPGRIRYIDGFGNAITDIPAGSHPPSVNTFAVRGHLLPLVKTYGEAVPNQAVVLAGSTGYLEIAVNQGNAQKQLQLEINDPVKPAENSQRK